MKKSGGIGVSVSEILIDATIPKKLYLGWWGEGFTHLYMNNNRKISFK